MSESNQNAYLTLGLTKRATDSEIKQAYVNLVKKYDPEKHTERFMFIQRAYDRLKTTKSRAVEDVYSFNNIIGEYLFQAGERCDDGAPDTDQLQKLRDDYKRNAMNEEKKQELCKALFRAAHQALQRKQLSAAIDYWSEVLDNEPSHIRARQNLVLACSGLGYSYAMHGLFEESVDLWEKALQINPDNIDLIHNLALAAEKAQLYAKAGNYWAQVVERWKRQLDRDQENEYLRNCIVEALNHHGEYVEEHEVEIKLAEQKAAINKAVPSKTTLPKIARYTEETDSKSKVQVPERKTSRPRVTSREERQAKTPASSPANTAVSSGEQKTPSSDRHAAPSPAPAHNSIDRYREILKLKPGDFDAHFQLCNKLMEEQLYDEAKDQLMQLAKAHPKNTEVLNLLGWALLNSGQKDLAFNAWKKSLSIDPKNSDTREQLVRAHLAMGKAFRNKGLFTQSLVHFKQLIQLMPKSSEVHLEIAATYDMKGDTRSAAHEYNRVLALDPKNKVARKALNDLRLKR